MKKILFATFALIVLIGIALWATHPSPPKQNMGFATNVWAKSTRIDKKDAKKIRSQRKQMIKGDLRQDSPNEFANYHNLIRTAYGEKAPAYGANYKIIELEKSLRRIKGKHRGEKLNWISRGPGNIGGRSRGIVIDPDDATGNTWFIAAVGGGVWKTTDAGTTWRELSGNTKDLNTSCIAMSQSNHNILYVGTGEGYGNLDALGGSGIWKSTDRGETWTQLSSTANLDFGTINRIIIDPQNPDILLAATSFKYNNETNGTSGVWKSTNGGESWVKTFDLKRPVQQIIAQPNDFNVQYASVNGIGIYKSEDAGETWTYVSSDILGITRMEMAIPPTKPERIYVSADGGIYSSTLYMSDDAGKNWIYLNDIGSNIDFLGGQGWYDNAITVDPYNEDNIFVAGVNFYNIKMAGYESRSGLTSVEFPYLKNYIESAESDLSFNGLGIADELFNTTLTENDYTSVEIRLGGEHKQNAYRFEYGDNYNYLYKEVVEVPFEVWDVDKNRQLMVSFRDYNKDGKFDLAENNDNSTSKEFIFVHSQPYTAYSNPYIARNGGNQYRCMYFAWLQMKKDKEWILDSIPKNAAVRFNYGNVLIPQISTQLVADGYNPDPSWVKGIHVDHHFFAVHKLNETEKKFRLVGTNDGGVCYTDNKGETFTQPITGFVTTQFYGVDKANGKNIYIGGMQDNSSFISSENPDNLSEWKLLLGGDGFDCAYHYGDANKYMVSSQFNRIGVTHDNGETMYMASIEVGSGAAPFMTKIAKSNQDPDLVFTTSGSGLWRTKDFGLNWQLISMPPAFIGNRTTAEVKISLANPMVVWAGNSVRTNREMFLSLDGGETFSATNVYEKTEMGELSGFATHPTQPYTAYALFSAYNLPKILKTNDKGQTWNDISGFDGTGDRGFPDVAVYDLLVMPYNDNILWAGTEIGIFESTDGGATWHFADNGFPACSVFDLRIVNNQVVAGTHGRGIWSVEIPELNGYEPRAVALKPNFDIFYYYNADNNTQHAKVKIEYRGSYDVVKIYRNETVIQELSNVPSGNAEYIFDLEDGENIFYVVCSDDGFNFRSADYSISKNNDVFPLNTYVNFFDTPTSINDFTGTGYNISMPENFSSSALNSEHPYGKKEQFIITLRYPIIVSATNSIVQYDDIAIVEIGEPGTVYGDFEFWDYVTLEGSVNGETWTNLLTPYDANFNSEWLRLYEGALSPTASNYLRHTIDLKDFYDAGTTILLRFRLFSDDEKVGWGWIIDNLKIQENSTSIHSDKKFNISLFPNPANQFLELESDAFMTKDYTYEIVDIAGRTMYKGKLEKSYSDSKTINIQFLRTGMYFIRLNNGTEFHTLKFQKGI